MKVERTELLEKWITNRLSSSYRLVHGAELPSVELEESLEHFFSYDREYVDYKIEDNIVKYFVSANSSAEYSKPFYDVDIHIFYYSPGTPEPQKIINHQIKKIKKHFETERIMCLFAKNSDSHIVDELKNLDTEQKNIYFRGYCSHIHQNYKKSISPVTARLKLDQYDICEYTDDEFEELSDLVAIDMANNDGYFGGTPYDDKEKKAKKSMWERYSESGRGVLVKNNGVTVGAILITINPHEKYSNCSIADLFIKKEYRKKGILNLLFHELVNTIIERDVKYIGGGTQNPMILKILNKLGIPLISTLYHI